MIKQVIVFFFLFSFSSCNTNDVPGGILPKDKMQTILWQQIKADIYTKENLSLDSTKKYDLNFENIKIQTQIFKNNNITKDEFYKSYYYYLNHEEKLALIIDSIISFQTRANFEELRNQSDRYNQQRIRNIFMEEILKKKPVTIFSMNPDTLPKEMIVPNRYSQNNFNQM